MRTHFLYRKAHAGRICSFTRNPNNHLQEVVPETATPQGRGLVFKSLRWNQRLRTAAVPIRRYPGFPPMHRRMSLQAMHRYTSYTGFQAIHHTTDTLVCQRHIATPVCKQYTETPVSTRYSDEPIYKFPKVCAPPSSTIGVASATGVPGVPGASCLSRVGGVGGVTTTVGFSLTLYLWQGCKCSSLTSAEILSGWPRAYGHPQSRVMGA